jgi:hypothetical protein
MAYMDEKKRSPKAIRDDVEVFAMTMTQYKSRLEKLMALVDEYAEAYLEENWIKRVIASRKYVHEDDIKDYVYSHADDLAPKDESRE